MNLTIKRTGKMFNLLWRDIWPIIKEYYSACLLSMLVVGAFTIFICQCGLKVGENSNAMKPWVNNVFEIAVFMMMSSASISIAIGCSYPVKWVRTKWRASCKLFPKPDIWDREDN